MATLKKFFYGYVVAAAGFTIWLIGWGSHNTYGVFFKPLLSEFGWNRAETATAMSLFLIVISVAAIGMGWLTDRLGPRLVVTIFGSALGIAYLLMSRMTDLWQFQVNYAVFAAVGLSTTNVPVMATISRWFVRRRGLMIGLVQAGTGIGGLIFIPFAGWLIHSYGWRSSYVIIGIIALAGMLIPGLLLRRDPKDVGQLPDGAGESIAAGASGQTARFKESGLSFVEAFRTRKFWMIAGLYSSFGFCRSVFMTHLAAHVQDTGFSLTDGANVLAALTGASMVGRIGMGRLADVIGSRASFIFSYAIMTVAIAWIIVAKDLPGLYLFAIVFGFAWGAQAVLRFSIASEAFGLLALGTVMAALGVAENAAGSFASYFAGYLFDSTGSYRPAFLMGAGACAVSILVAYALKPYLEQRR